MTWISDLGKYASQHRTGIILSACLLVTVGMIWRSIRPSRLQTRAQYEQAFRFLEEQGCLFPGEEITIHENATNIELTSRDYATGVLYFTLNISFSQDLSRAFEFHLFTNQRGHISLHKVLAEPEERTDFMWQIPTSETTLRFEKSSPGRPYACVVRIVMDPNENDSVAVLLKADGDIYLVSYPR